MIIVGLYEGNDGFFVVVCELILEDVLLLFFEDFFDVEEWCLFYVVMM